MRYLQPLKVEFIGIKKSSFEDRKTGKTVDAFKLQFDYQGEICLLKCTKDVYEKLADTERFKEILVTTQYNDDYPQKPDYRVIDVLTN